MLIIVCVILSISSSIVLGKDESNSLPIEVSYCQLAKDPSLFVGKRIKIHALYRHTIETQLLESPVCCSEKDIRIWVQMDMNLDDRSEKMFRKIDKSHGTALVVFIGRLDGNGPYGTFSDKYQLKVDEIKNIEQTSKSLDPSWAPKDCGSSLKSK